MAKKTDAAAAVDRPALTMKILLPNRLDAEIDGKTASGQEIHRGNWGRNQSSRLTEAGELMRAIADQLEEDADHLVDAEDLE